MHKPQDYLGQTPKLELFEYFAGKTYAWGQFQDRSGKVLKRFRVDIDGRIDGQKLVLDEQFLYSDGEKQQRVWTIQKSNTVEEGVEQIYSGVADDVVGEAIGKVSGNALNWRYVLDMPYKNGSIHLSFNDWMFLQQNGILLNRAEVTKWGFKVGEVTLMFSKSLPNEGSWINGL